MAVELADAYVSIVPSAEGIQGKLAELLGAEADAAGRRAGEDTSGGFGRTFNVAPFMAAAGVAAGVVLATAIYEGVQQEAQTDRLAASLGLDDAEAAALGESTGSIYAQAYGDSFGGVQEVLRTAFLVDTDATQEDLEALTIKALNLEAAFGIAGSEALTFASQLTEQGITGSVTESLDFITKAFQQLPSDMQGPLQDALSEYAPFLADLGFSTEDTFALLTAAAAEGEFQLDKTGDALKEFGIRATDGSKASTAAFEAIGLDAQAMAADLLAGGDTAAGAFDQIVEGLLAIEDPVERANASIALFGTPIEDLGVNGIPDFLAGLSDSPGTFAEVAGSADALDATLNDNLATTFETFKRSALQGLADVATEVVLPALGELQVGAEAFLAAFNGEGVTSDGFIGFVEQVGVVARDVVDFFVENWPAIRTTVGEVLTEVGAIIASFVKIAVALWETFGDDIIRFAEGAWVLVSGVIGGALEIIQGILDVFIGVFTGDWDRAWEGIKGIVGGAVDIVVALVEGGFGMLSGIVGAVLSALSAVISAAWTGIVSGVSGLGSRIASAAVGIFDGVKDAFRDAINWVIDRWNNLSFSVPTVDLGPLGEFGGQEFNTPNIPRLHSGGIVPGRPGQEVPAILLAGERVLSVADTRAYDAGRDNTGMQVTIYNDGRPLLEQLNELQIHSGVLARVS